MSSQDVKNRELQVSPNGLSRRTVLRGGSLAAGSILLGNSLPAWASLESAAGCALTPEIQAGPYYVDYEIMRKDIREHKAGLPLHVQIALVHAKTCRPLESAAVDLWHCDASGVYSGYSKYSPDSIEPFKLIPPPSKDNPAPSLPHTDNETFLRGVQLTDHQGAAEFLTIYPGWYITRDTHIHVSVHTGGSVGMKYRGGHICHIGQIGFSDETSDAVAKLEPYVRHKARRTRLNEDKVFHAPLRDDMLFKLERIDPAKLEAGFRAKITLTVDPEAQPAPLPPGPDR